MSNNQELIPVFAGEIAGVPTQLVDARTLHTFLESKQQFSHWIQDRIKEYGFTQDVDFIVIDNFIYDETAFGGQRKVIDYHLTLDTGKEVSMVEKNAKGKQARRYFIECENRLHNQAPLLPELQTLLLSSYQNPLPIADVQNLRTQAHKRLDSIVDNVPMVGLLADWQKIKSRKYFKTEPQASATIPGMENISPAPQSSHEDKHYYHWKDADIAILRSLYDQGLPHKVIGEKMGRTKRAIEGAIQRFLLSN